MTNNDSKKSEITVSVQPSKPIEVFIPEDIVIHYADTFTVQHTPEEIILSFLQTQYPIALTEEAQNKIETIECLCLARIALTPARFQGFLQLLQNRNELLNPTSKQPDQKEGE